MHVVCETTSLPIYTGSEHEEAKCELQSTESIADRKNSHSIYRVCVSDRELHVAACKHTGCSLSMTLRPEIIFTSDQANSHITASLTISVLVLCRFILQRDIYETIHKHGAAVSVHAGSDFFTPDGWSVIEIKCVGQLF